MPTLDAEASDPQYHDIWKAAIREYEKTTKVALPANLDSVDDVLYLVEEQQKQFAEFRNKKQLRPMVKDVLSMVESFTEVVGAGVGVVR